MSVGKCANRRAFKSSMGDKLMSLKKILVATDYSAASKEALRVASSLARDSGATLLICHVSELEPYPVGEPAPAGPPSDPAALKELKTVVPAELGIPHEHHLLFGEPGSAEITKPAEVILKFANENGVDMVVLGTQGRSGLRHLLMGSVAEHVVRHAECPVTTVRV